MLYHIGGADDCSQLVTRLHTREGQLELKLKPDETHSATLPIASNGAGLCLWPVN